MSRPPTSRQAIMRVSARMLLDALGLPDHVTLHDVRMCFEQPDVAELRIESPELGEVAFGAVIPRADALFDAEEGFLRFE